MLKLLHFSAGTIVSISFLFSLCEVRINRQDKKGRESMATRKRKGGWGSIVNKKKNNYAKDTKQLEREFISKDRVNVPALLLSSKYTERANQEITVLIGHLNPSCIGSQGGERCDYIEVGPERIPTLRIKPSYSYPTMQSFKNREKHLEKNFPITSEDMFVLKPGTICKLYCKKNKIPEKKFVIVNLIDFGITCTVGEPWGVSSDMSMCPGESDESQFKKSFFVKASSIEVKATPDGNDVLRLLYHYDAVVRRLCPLEERAEELKLRCEAAAAFKAGYTEVGAAVMNKLWESDTWQTRFLPSYQEPLIFQMCANNFMLEEYFKRHKCGCDELGRMFELSPLGVGSSVHEDDVMQFQTRTSMTDDTKVPAWRFIAYAMQATVKEEVRDEKEEDELAEEDLEDVMEHTVKFAMFSDLCVTMGFPQDLDDYEKMMAVYYLYLPVAFSCKLEADRTLRRPENENGSAYSVKVENVVGPMRQFWETIGIPVSKEVAINLLDSHPRGKYLSKKAMPSECNNVFCLSDLDCDETAIDAIKKCDGITTSLFVVLCKSPNDGILPHVYSSLVSFDVWNPEDAVEGDTLIDCLFNDEPDVDFDNLEEESNKAYNALYTMQFFDGDAWKFKSSSFLFPFIYSTTKPPEMENIERLALQSFIGN